MKTIGLTVAMDKELSLLKEFMDCSVEKADGGFEFYIGKFDEDTILIVSKSGIGKVNSALCVSQMINRYHPDIIISSGVCGCLNMKNVYQGDIICASSVCYHDVWCGSPNEYGQVQDMPAEYETISSEDIDEIVFRVKKEFGIDVHKGHMLSGDLFVDNMVRAQIISNRFCDDDDSVIYGIDMESGSIAQTCYRYKVPFCSVRIISDVPLSTDKNQRSYSNFWDVAPVNLNNIVKIVINSLK